MRKLIRVFLTLLIASNGNAYADGGFDSDYQLQRSNSYIQDKNFYLLTLFQEVTEASEVLSENDAFRKVHKKKMADLMKANKNFNKNIQFNADAYSWDAKED